MSLVDAAAQIADQDARAAYSPMIDHTVAPITYLFPQRGRTGPERSVGSSLSIRIDGRKRDADPARCADSIRALPLDQRVPLVEQLI